MVQPSRFLGLDVHKETIAVAVCEGSDRPQAYGTIANDPAAIRKLVRAVGGGKTTQLMAAYEAGPTGFVVQRQLARLGVDCIVAAPSLIPRPVGERVKNDRRDAVLLARLLRSGDLTPVWIPDQAQEALRDLVRARADAKVDLLRARHRLAKFLLRKGITPPFRMQMGSLKYQAWLKQLRFQSGDEEIVFQDYWRVVDQAVERVRQLEKELRAAAERSPHLSLIATLQCLRGIAFLSAVTIVAEAGDLRRFKTARQFMAYTGLVPSEHSSGEAVHRGPITKTGNALLRHVLGEAAHHARHRPSTNGALRQRQAGVPPPLVELAGKAQQRLHLRYRHLSGRLGSPRALTAVARELAGFVWALGQAASAAA